MGKLTSLVFLAGVLTLASPAFGQVLHQVHVGGPDICEAMGYRPGCHANFSLVALEFADGRVAGELTDRGFAGSGFHAFIDCLSINGNEAWVGGVITRGSIGDADVEGLRIVTRVRDNGTSRNEPPDEISFSVIDGPVSCLEQPPYPLYSVPQGQVMIR